MSIQLSMTVDLPPSEVAAEFMHKLAEAFALLKGLASMPTIKPAVARGTTAPDVIIGEEPPKPAEPAPAEAPKPASEKRPRATKAAAPADGARRMQSTEAPAESAPALGREEMLDQLRTLGNALVNKLGGEAVRGVLRRFNVARYPDLSDGDMAAVLAEFKTLSASA